MVKAEMMFLRRTGFGGERAIAGEDNRQNKKSATEPKCDDCLQQAKPPTRIPSNENCLETTILLEEGVKTKLEW